MSSRLRRMMGKRSLKNSATDPADMESPSRSSPEESRSSPLKKREPVAQDDLSDVPPPSPEKIKAVERSTRKVSPSKTLLDRYKNRSTTSVTASPPAIKIPASTLRDSTRSPSPKGTTFRPDFNHSPDPLANAADSANGGGKSKGKDKAGAEVEAPSLPDVPKKSTKGSEMDKLRNDENVSPMTIVDTSEPKSRRSTRSITRRQERADSKQDSNVSTKDFASLSLSPADVPPGLNIWKSAASRTPSPCSPKSKPAESKQEDASLSTWSDVTSPARPKTPLPEESFERPSTPPSSDTPPEIPPKSPKRCSFSNSLKEGIDNNVAQDTNDTQDAEDTEAANPQPTTKPTLKPTTPLLPTAPLSPTTPKDSPVAVRPPLYDASKTPGKQWESDYGSSSRPHSPWMHSKRWTCCVCQGQTIVEQVVCSRLSCVHDRCPSKCRVEGMDRARGPHQR
ncbi:hypothetical protein M409DRAFT_26655 [Zasmidium cellare ATCC 36951]|uniref:Uncharacterized protein n=1 Tax=Zasmidium cellare ATCC 36951 TaxID=1080233 RepID=A0A6A6C982_ZASCE|nr:uncharacterized protein M409DRAFT_26655 [Zasmidium cellare ATCC 36951]KAF2162800.1 hypothetical protein M409DRAFT_26655 [Zasmidium cellare ATCC 36951]